MFKLEILNNGVSKAVCEHKKGFHKLQEYIRPKAKNSLVKKLANSVNPEGLDI